MNRWNIPKNLEIYIRQRDLNCVYCGIEFSQNNRKAKASWEHIVNNENIVTKENIALCCLSCNASKGSKNLRDWLENSQYCKSKNITKDSVAKIIKIHLNSL